jgi:xanthine dehydrogenase YagR molybdenum-binding subunit
LLAESQIQGGFIQGMGMALYEERIMDPRVGMMLNNHMHEYLIPTILDTPEQLVVLDAQTLDQSNSINVKGLGEPPLVGAGAAIANAIYNAIGVRIRHYPITPDKILTALHHPTVRGASRREQ